MKSGLLNTYSFLGHDVVCDVAVVGAGITGAMAAHRLSSDGLCVVVIDGSDVCRGSTSASTALLQYEIDVSLTDLAKLIDSPTNCWQPPFAMVPRFSTALKSPSLIGPQTV